MALNSEVQRCASCEEPLENQDPVHCDACLNEGMDEQCEKLTVERDEVRREAEAAYRLLERAAEVLGVRRVGREENALWIDVLRYLYDHRERHRCQERCTHE